MTGRLMKLILIIISALCVSSLAFATLYRFYGYFPEEASLNKPWKWQYLDAICKLKKTSKPKGSVEIRIRSLVGNRKLGSDKGPEKIEEINWLKNYGMTIHMTIIAEGNIVFDTSKIKLTSVNGTYCDIEPSSLRKTHPTKVSGRHVVEDTEMDRVITYRSTGENPWYGFDIDFPLSFEKVNKFTIEFPPIELNGEKVDVPALNFEKRYVDDLMLKHLPY